MKHMQFKDCDSVISRLYYQSFFYKTIQD